MCDRRVSGPFARLLAKVKVSSWCGLQIFWEAARSVTVSSVPPGV